MYPLVFAYHAGDNPNHDHGAHLVALMARNKPPMAKRVRRIVSYSNDRFGTTVTEAVTDYTLYPSSFPPSLAFALIRGMICHPGPSSLTIPMSSLVTTRFANAETALAFFYSMTFGPKIASNDWLPTDFNFGPAFVGTRVDCIPRMPDWVSKDVATIGQDDMHLCHWSTLLRGSQFPRAVISNLGSMGPLRIRVVFGPGVMHETSHCLRPMTISERITYALINADILIGETSVGTS